MMSKIFRKLSDLGPAVSIISLAATVFGLIFFYQFVNSSFLGRSISQNDIPLILGVFAVLMIALKSMAQDINSIFWRQPRIVCGLGPQGTYYDIDKFLSGKPKTVVVVAQNMYTLLSRNQDLFLTRIKIVLEDPNSIVKFVLTTEDAMRAIEPRGIPHLEWSLKRLKSFYLSELNIEERDRFKVYVDKGASSLSVVIRDRLDSSKARLVFTAKYSTDSAPSQRLFCVIDKWEYPDLFGKIDGAIEMMCSHDHCLSDTWITN